MNKEKLINQYEKMKANKKRLTSVDLVLKDLRSLDEPEPLPFELKDVIKRIKGFDDGTKFQWMYGILKELGSDFGSKMFHEAYQQGRFDEGIEAHYEPEKVKVSEEEAKFLKTFDFNYEGDVTTALYYVSRTGWGYHLTDGNGTELKHLTREARLLKNRKRLIKAILDGYEVDKKKRYVVKIPVVNQYLVRVKDENFLGFLSSKLRTYFTRKELEEAGLGWVFDCPGIEIEEVE